MLFDAIKIASDNKHIDKIYIVIHFLWLILYSRLTKFNPQLTKLNFATISKCA